MHEQLHEVWQLGVDDGHKCCKHMSEVGGCSLCFHDCFGQQTFTSEQVEVEQLESDSVDVGDVDLVDNAIDGLSKGFPLLFLLSF